MLSEGKGGMMDYGKYRKTLTDIVWRGIEPELTPEERAEQAKAASGQPPPADALAEARALFEAAKRRREESAN
jgi:hypothetical protein